MMAEQALVVKVAVCMGLVACTPHPGPSNPSSPADASADAQPAGKPVGTGSLHETVVVEHYLVLIPDANDEYAATGAARAVPAHNDIHVKLEIPPPADAAARVKLVDAYNARQSDRPDIKRTQRILDIIVAGPASKTDDTMHTAARCAYAAAVAGHGWLVDVHTMVLFTPDVFQQRRPDGFPLDADTLVATHIRKDERAASPSDTVYLETTGLLSFGLPELRMRGIPARLEDRFSEVFHAAAQTLIERGGLARPGQLDVDLHTLTGEGWLDVALAVSAQGGSGKVTFLATWLNADADTGRRMIELALPDGTTVEGALATFSPEPAPPQTYDALPPEIEAAARRAQAELVALASHFAAGIPDNGLLLVKVAVPLDSGDVAQWMWLPVTSVKPDEVEFFVPDKIGPYTPPQAGKSFRVPMGRILDYRHLRADHSDVGGETDRFPQTRPPARLRLGK
jgi:hypothetical protein